jgi:hypothetical protein
MPASSAGRLSASVLWAYELKLRDGQKETRRMGSRKGDLLFSGIRVLEHDPEKCEAVFRKDHAQTTT